MTPTLLIPALSDLMKIVSVPVTTRSISKLSDGMILPCACMIIGTRRTMPSRSGSMVSRPRPAGRLFQHRHVAQQARKLEHEALRVLAQHREPGHRKRLVEFADDLGKPGFAQHHARAPHRIGENLIVARQLAQLAPGRLIEIAEGVGGGIGIEPVGLGEDDVEGDHHGAEPGQIGDHVRDARARPRPLAELGQAGFVDIDNGDRPCRLHAGIDDAGRCRRS